MPRTSDTVGSHETTVYTDSDGALCVRYHKTVVWAMSPDGKVKLNSGGYLTSTTKRRMNEAFRQYVPNPFGVFQRKGEWYVSRYMGNGIHLPAFPYRDFMVIDTRREGL